MVWNLLIINHMQTKTVIVSKNKGFTLLELLIVMGIISILLIIVVPQFNFYKMRGCNSAAISDLKNFKAAMESFYAEHNSYPNLLY